MGYRSQIDPSDREARREHRGPQESPLCVTKGAVFSQDRTYRYHLWRHDGNDKRKNHVMFIGLNPSTADEETDDMTIRKCLGFAKRWGYRGIHMLNLFAFVATQPRLLLDAATPICEPGGADRTDNLLGYYGLRCGRVVACWGSLSAAHRKILRFDQRVAAVMDLIPQPIYCLGKTADGSPRHPSRIAYSTPLELYLKPSG